MSPEIIAVVIGSIIGTVCTLLATLLIKGMEDNRRSKSVKAFVKAEITAIKDKAERYLEGESSPEELSASTPIYSGNIMSEIGYLTPNQVISFRRAVTLDMEMRKDREKDKAKLTMQACEKALKLF
jgi:ABC-type lipoprotein release transport system permease subunit